jgi:3',5'-cyclic AMP phosphodiesterase CpdA
MTLLDAPSIRLIHVSDIHFWQYALNPLQLFSKRLLGMASLLVRRARRFRLERVHEVVERVIALQPDHILITGDLTTTALPAEFRAAKRALGQWLDESEKVTIVPGNHDRYTVGAHRDRRFEQFFGEFAPAPSYPWLRFLDGETAILGLDPTRAGLSARGKLPEPQLDRARELLSRPDRPIRRLIVACHYPVDAPAAYHRELAGKNLMDAEPLIRWLSELGPHLYCCGHVHAAWAFSPGRIPHQLCLNAGAPLLRDGTGHRPPGFLETVIADRDVTVTHHAWRAQAWEVIPLCQARAFFPAASGSARSVCR